ncbi:hypothetical protein AB205_0141750, partial [Aquarana catesbeiana]
MDTYLSRAPAKLAPKADLSLSSRVEAPPSSVRESGNEALRLTLPLTLHNDEKCPVLDCDQLLKPDSCKGYIPRYYYDKETGTCKSFIYGGCGGNENNFTTKEKCEAMCMP